MKLKNSNGDETQKLKGFPPGRILYCKIPVVVQNGTTSNRRGGPNGTWNQLQSEAAQIPAVPLFARSRFVHDGLFWRLSSAGWEATLPVIGWEDTLPQPLNQSALTVPV